MHDELFLFLLAFLLYNDGVSTTIKMAVDYGLAIGFDSRDLMIALLLVQFVGVPATYVYGKLFSHFSPKSGIYTAIAIYLLAITWGGFMDSVWEFYGLAILIGLVQGGIQSLSRSFYSRRIPDEREAEFFGLYSLLGRFSGIFGPLAMGAVGLLTGQSRWTLLAIAVFFLAGGALLLTVKETRAAELSRRLIEEKGFSFIAVEGDWPDCYRVNRYIKNYRNSGENAHEVLHDFQRWPTWMWANREVVELAEWLRSYNDQQRDNEKVGFFGLDVYSLWDSLYHVLGYLAKHDPSSLPAARQAFQCFEPYGEDVQEYARATRWINESCEDEVVALLARLRQDNSVVKDGDHEASFNTDQNALVVKNAEHYYRAMVQGGSGSWNVRDHHMAEILERLMQHHGPEAKGIVWEHNRTHRRGERRRGRRHDRTRRRNV